MYRRILHKIPKRLTGYQVRKIYKALGYTQIELADLLVDKGFEVCPGTISKWVNANRKVKKWFSDELIRMLKDWEHKDRWWSEEEERGGEEYVYFSNRDKTYGQPKLTLADLPPIENNEERDYWLERYKKEGKMKYHEVLQGKDFDNIKE